MKLLAEHLWKVVRVYAYEHKIPIVTSDDFDIALFNYINYAIQNN